MRKIVAEGVIRARDQNKVFVERASSRRLSPTDAVRKYGMPRGKANAYVEFDMEPELVVDRENDRMQCVESFIVGNVNLTNRNPEAFFNF